MSTIAQFYSQNLAIGPYQPLASAMCVNSV
jgi:hypothetical protein